ncbi:2Fe-2S iron-sulfur cluster-binding protein [Desulfobaculum bizertense]|uniref:2Fe-2S iron-sulfur cluster binding domain-containing protein n=1 Tax=Desulfobaculum bizertense DSM 18034 TaxID=1121442 RepID=A0A1T4WCE2_9BACT|nr:2Fe-2S iron-sulfur cluster binding domain-containing protein [Desulfobaculum bizertense DSM 18034]
MYVMIDGKRFEFIDSSLNIVEVAKQGGLSLLAPCYRAKRKKGCCKACVVEINGQQRYACATTAENGMEIVADRPDLHALRRERLAEYKKNPMQECTEHGACNCVSSACSDGCCS